MDLRPQEARHAHVREQQGDPCGVGAHLSRRVPKVKAAGHRFEVWVFDFWALTFLVLAGVGSKVWALIGYMVYSGYRRIPG